MPKQFQWFLSVITLYGVCTLVFAPKGRAQNPSQTVFFEPNTTAANRTSSQHTSAQHALSQHASSPKETSPFLIAAPQNLNPELASPPEPSSTEPALIEHLPEEERPTELEETLSPTESSNTPPLHTTHAETTVPFIEWQGLEIDFNDSFSNFGQDNRLTTPVFAGQLANGDNLSFSPGFNQFASPDVEQVYHIPLTVTWEGNINDVSLTVGGGLDIYDRLPLDTHFDAKVAIPAWEGATVSLSLEQGPYLFNVQTLENGISAWRYGPELSWQIDPKTSLFSLVRIGHFNDGNFEQQSFSRLERELWEEAAIALNLFNWHFRQDLELTSGYFSPADLLVSSVELSWEREVIENISCRLAGNLGQQRLNGDWAVGYGHQLLCAFDLIPGISFDLGYNYSNVGNGQTLLSEDSAYNNFQLLGGVNTKF